MLFDTGIHLQLLLGAEVPIPAPAPLAAAVQAVEVRHRLGERSAFQVTLAAPYADLAGPLFSVFNRLVLVVIIGARARVLIDGFITNHSHQPGETPPMTLLTLTGEDISLAMDRERRPVQHPGQSDPEIAAKIMGQYARHGLVPRVAPLLSGGSPGPNDHTPLQTRTDLAYLRELAGRHGYVFHVLPGPETSRSTGYWGPPLREPVPQPALSLHLGSHSTVESLNFQHNALATETVAGPVQDGQTNEVYEVYAGQSTAAPLAALPDWLTHAAWVRRQHYCASGPSVAEAQEFARGTFMNSLREALTGAGELDTARYGEMLEVGRLVGVRGAGVLYDGNYLVQAVTHNLRRGAYRQTFTIAREGLGSTTPVVRL